MAGGWDSTTGGAPNFPKHSKIVERSTNNGSSFQTLPDIPYGSTYGLFGACLVVIDANTVFLAGGRMGRFPYKHFTSHILHLMIKWTAVIVCNNKEK